MRNFNPTGPILAAASACVVLAGCATGGGTLMDNVPQGDDYCGGTAYTIAETEEALGVTETEWMETRQWDVGQAMFLNAPADEAPSPEEPWDGPYTPVSLLFVPADFAIGATPTAPYDDCGPSILVDGQFWFEASEHAIQFDAPASLTIRQVEEHIERTFEMTVHPYLGALPYDGPTPEVDPTVGVRMWADGEWRPVTGVNRLRGTYTVSVDGAPEAYTSLAWDFIRW